MISTDKLTDGQLIDLPAEAGDPSAAQFEPDDGWLAAAEPALQKTAMWRWFATRFEEPAEAVPHDDEGNYLWDEGGPCRAGEVLRQRFGGRVPAAVLDEFIERVEAEGGAEWAPRRLDKAGD